MLDLVHGVVAATVEQGLGILHRARIAAGFPRLPSVPLPCSAAAARHAFTTGQRVSRELARVRTAPVRASFPRLVLEEALGLGPQAGGGRAELVALDAIGLRER